MHWFLYSLSLINFVNLTARIISSVRTICIKYQQKSVIIQILFRANTVDFVSFFSRQQWLNVFEFLYAHLIEPLHSWWETHPLNNQNIIHFDHLRGNLCSNVTTHSATYLELSDTVIFPTGKFPYRKEGSFHLFYWTVIFLFLNVPIKRRNVHSQIFQW